MTDLRTRAARQPRVRLAQTPTPLEPLDRLSAQLPGVRIWCKRDDLTGFAFGGNKVRHAEFLLGEAVARGCDVVVWGAGVQSNNCRVTAAACAKLGIECRLFLSVAYGQPAVQGNLLLDHLYGAKIEFVNAPLGPELDHLLMERANDARREGRTPYVWDRPRVIGPAAVSYALCSEEIAEQCTQARVRPTAIYVASAGSTGAGLVLGTKLLDWSVPVVSVGYIRWPWDAPTEMAATATEAGRLLGYDTVVSAADVRFDLSQMGERYGEIPDASREAFQLMARTEAIILDPVYTSKALAALIADARAGRVGGDVVFVHTGGAPAVFAEPSLMI